MRLSPCTATTLLAPDDISPEGSRGLILIRPSWNHQIDEYEVSFDPNGNDHSPKSSRLRPKPDAAPRMCALPR